MFCITTKYLGPTNTKGARIKATDGELTRVVHFDYGADVNKQMLDVAKKLAVEIRDAGRVGVGWTAEHVGSAWTPGGRSKAHLFR